MLRDRIAIASVVAAPLALGAPALAELVDTDILVTASGTRLVTGGWDHESGTVINPDQRVFWGDLGVDPSFPFSGDEPGISSTLQGTSLRLNVLNSLSVWNGSSFQASNSLLTVGYGGQSADTAAGGFLSFAVTTPLLHVHPDYTLSGPGATDPANGLYLASFFFASNDLADSQTIWIVLNLGMTEEDHEAAVMWVESNLVPAPGAVALLGVAALGRRRRA